MPIAIIAGLLLLGAPAQDRDLTVSFGPEPQTLDPGTMSGVNESRFAYALFEGLLTYAEDGVTPAPGVAERWTVSADRSVYTFRLRKTSWSNGDPLTAQDFVRSWLRANDPETGSDYASMLWYVKNARAWHFAKSVPGVVERFRRETPDAEERARVAEILLEGARRDHVPLLEKTRDIAPADDDKKLLDRAIEKARGREPLAERDVGVRAVDDATLEVTLERPTPFILDVFAFHTLMPVHPTIAEHPEPERSIGNGPFVIDRWRASDRIELKKNPNYFDAAHVRSERIVLRFADDAEKAWAMYEKGEVDFLDRIQIPADRLDELRRRDDFHAYPAFGAYFLRFNTSRPPFNDAKVRKAFAHAINRKALTELLGPGEVPRDTLTPPFPGYDPGTKGCPFDEARAKKMMDGAFPDRAKFPRITLLGTDRARSRSVEAALRGQWKETLGVDVVPRSLNWSDYLTAMSTLEYDVVFGGWQGDYADPHTFIDLWVTGGGNNRTGWGTKQYDAWVDEALVEGDPAKRFAIYRKCEKVIVEDECVVVPLYGTGERVMMKPRLKGVKTNVMDRFLLKYFYVER